MGKDVRRSAYRRDQIGAHQRGSLPISSTLVFHLWDQNGQAGFFDVLRWWALGGDTMGGLYETGEEFEIPTGQSSFARCFFDEALQTQNLVYSFNTPVRTIEDKGNQVVVNNTWTAKRLTCAVPLNVLRDVSFEPALDVAWLAATPMQTSIMERRCTWKCREQAFDRGLRHPFR